MAVGFAVTGPSKMFLLVGCMGKIMTVEDSQTNLGTLPIKSSLNSSLTVTDGDHIGLEQHGSIAVASDELCETTGQFEKIAVAYVNSSTYVTPCIETVHFDIYDWMVWLDERD